MKNISTVKEQQNDTISFSDIFDTLWEGIIITDTNGVILFCNKAAVENYSTPPARLIGHRRTGPEQHHRSNFQLHGL